MSRIRELLEAKKKSGEKAFIPYITAGDPTLDATESFVRELVAAGADVIELGVPYSDPVADGPTNLKAAARALKNGVSLGSCIERVAQMRAAGIQVPFVLFTYYNPIHRYGISKFAADSKKAGVDAVLAVDLPPEEADEYSRALRDAGLGTIFLASPTTRPERIAKISELSSEFLYYVSRTGVTGVKSELATDLEPEVKALRTRTELPIGVGFGISTAEQARSVAKVADAVIVGSALVQLIEKNPDPEKAKQALGQLARSLKEGTRC